MFCMNCGQQLPDGAKFCLNCGTPQGAISPTASTNSESNLTNDNSTFKPAMCPNCNAHMKVDSSCMLARCDACGTECLVQDAIKALSNLTVKANVQVGNATINVNGTNTDRLLQRVEMMLADGDFRGAMSKCDVILDSEPANGEVYFYMLLSDLQCKTRSELADQKLPFDRNQYYIKAMKYGDPELRNELQGYLENIEKNHLKTLKEGDIFCFGSDNGQGLLWRILKINNNKFLLITINNICDLPYNQFDGSNQWSDSSLRKWLNNEFLYHHFSTEELFRILPYNLNEKNSSDNKIDDDQITDRVFLLSISQAKELFSDNKSRTTGSWWWLRSPGSFQGKVAFVYVDGDVISSGGHAVTDIGGVRPAMWIRLDN